MKDFVYRGAETNCISFPLGGIGSGCIGLAGNGRLIDWEIFNRPNKNSRNGFSHFAVKAERNGRVLDARVLNGDLPPPYMGMPGDSIYTGFGYGPDKADLTGLPHFKDAVFTGKYPFAVVDYLDPSFPGRMSLTAFNPFIPLQEDDSSIPAAFFEVCAENTTDHAITYTFCLSLSNPLPPNGTENLFEAADGLGILHLKTNKISTEDPAYGDMSIATDGAEVSCQQYWYHGGWSDDLIMFWKDFLTYGPLKNRNYPYAGKAELDAVPYDRDTASLAVRINVNPGETGKAHFVISWNYPNCVNYWRTDENYKRNNPGVMGWKNYYATLFMDSTASARYSLLNWDRLYGGTRLFQETLFGSALPQEVLDAVSANISILKSPTCLRLEDGEFYGWEGCHSHSGSCEGSCTHVWNYAYALPFLFPRLERSMRDLDFKYNLDETGRMAFRLQLPLGAARGRFRACADGQMGNVIKMYRDWKISGDSQWLAGHWASIKQAISYAWSDQNPDGWDRDRDGVMEGRQHHTLDMELFGPNSWLNGFYLAALKAGSEIAEHFNEHNTAAEYRALFEKGKAYTDKELFNGEYYVQKIDLADRSLLDRYASGASLFGESAADAYWNPEAGEIKYQLGDGCEIDQVVAQWHANLCGLGEIFDKSQTASALRSIYRNNFKKSMRNVFNPNRIYCLNDEAGAQICTWPGGARKPVIPVPYAEETMHGFEYQAACHMIQEGLVEEGLELVRGVRNRYDGGKRNPWNEFECGSNYARSMASYALLHAFSGFSSDLVHGCIAFQPLADGSYFFSVDSAWGRLERRNNATFVHVLMGRLSLESVRLPYLAGKQIERIGFRGTDVPFAVNSDGKIMFSENVLLKDGDSLAIVS